MTLTDKLENIINFNHYLIDESLSHYSKPVRKIWEGNKEKILERKDVKELLFDENRNRKPESKTIEGLISKYVLDGIKEREHYFGKGPNFLRYGSAALYAIGAGSIGVAVASALGGVMGPMAAAALAGSGLYNIIRGAVFGTVADVKDAIDSERAIYGEFEEAHEKGILGYLKRTATGTWQLIKTGLNPMTYIRNAKQLVEGLAYRVAGVHLFQYTPLSIVGAAADLYRSNRKFRDRVLEKIVDKAVAKVKGEFDITEKEPKIIPLEYGREADAAYTIMRNAQEPLDTKYIEPRALKKAA